VCKCSTIPLNVTLEKVQIFSIKKIILPTHKTQHKEKYFVSSMDALYFFFINLGRSFARKNDSKRLYRDAVLTLCTFVPTCFDRLLFLHALLDYYRLLFFIYFCYLHINLQFLRSGFHILRELLP
jgi:hypothetical protein